MNTVSATLRSLDDALTEMLGRVQPVGADEWVKLSDADHRVLATDLISDLDVPSFDNSQMDGYALRAKDGAKGAVLPLSLRIAAGEVAPALPTDTVARIFTGAPIPVGADAVLMQEDGLSLPDGRVQINADTKAGQWIRRRAEDIARGAIVLASGTILGPAQVGLAASLGVAQLSVRRRPRVALLSTGSELATPGEVAAAELKPGQIFNSNRYFLGILLKRWGADVIDLGVVPDSRQATLDALRQAGDRADLIVSTGGVSVGEEDHVKPCVQSLGELSLWQINMKPGKPLAFGRVGHAHFVGLPGNPVSSFVTALLLVRPLMRALHGLEQVELPFKEALAMGVGPKPDKRREFLRVKLCSLDGGRTGAQLFPNQNSSVLTSMHWADGLLDNPPKTQIVEGDVVRVLQLSELLSL